jgi:hypothetical protein
MKIKGVTIEGPNEELIIIPRGNGMLDIVFKARAVLNYDDFETLVKEPTAPHIMFAGETKSSPQLDNPKYLKEKQAYNEQRLSWLILKSLAATEDLEWDTVDMADSSTWINYDEELRSSGFSNIEIGRIRQGCMIANSLDQDTIDEARKHFLVMERLAAAQLDSPAAEVPTTQSGEPVKDSASGPKALD